MNKQKGVITLLMAAALASAATYVLVPRKFDPGEYGYYVDLRVMAQHLGCPFDPAVYAGMSTETERLQTRVKFRGSSDANTVAKAAGSLLADAKRGDCPTAVKNLEAGYDRILTTLAKGKP